MDDRLQVAYARIDAANSEDPNTEAVDGQELPKELVYGRRMTRTLERFAADAPEVVKLACRAQHLQRWKIPRDAYPRTRAGYLRWRRELQRMHAAAASAILAEVGYDETTCARVGALLQKRGLPRDPEAQLVEDVACLVFLEHYLPAFAQQHPEAKVVSILRKTWGKMSDAARREALRLDLGPLGELVEQALRPTEEPE